tara:strand:- start:729 stop:1268 length:540 start_codon:yes stop_codon:yes gene_type:complete
MNEKKNQLREVVEHGLEKYMFASRWFLAPVYVVLSFSLAVIMLKVVQEFVHNIPLMVGMDIRNLLLFVLHIVDLALIGNLVLMILFAGYENFVSKIDAAKDSEDKPSWMGKVDFSGLKLKLVSSIVAISGINLLEAFMSLKDHTDRELQWQVIIHLVFIASGLLLAAMDYIASKTHAKY